MATESMGGPAMQKGSRKNTGTVLWPGSKNCCHFVLRVNHFGSKIAKDWNKSTEI